MSSRVIHCVGMAALMGAYLAACGDGGGGPVEPPPPSVATKLAFSVEPADAVVGQALSPAIQVMIQDATGNHVSDASDAITLAIGSNPGSSTLSGTETVNAVSGVASFSGLSVEKPGIGYTLTATAAGLTGATSATFDIAVRAAVQLAFTAQPSTSTVGVAISPAVEVTVQDEFGNTVTTATDDVAVAIGTNPSGGPLRGTATISAVGGIATFSDLSIDLLGSGYTLLATSGSLSASESAAFDIVLTFASISAGANHTCGLTAGGSIYCWGSNDFRQLGDGTTTNRLTPVPVSGGLSFASVSLGIGINHTCGITSSGGANCWGQNDNGQLGDGTTAEHFTPVPVSGGLSFTSVSAGESHTCGMTTSGDAYCWGSNSNGQLGDGTTTARLTPVPVSGGLTFALVSAGSSYTCGITTGGTTYCWGANGNGQLGDGTTTQSLAPGLLSGGLSLASVSAGFSQSCGLTSGGDTYCWGRNQFGMLGDGTTTDRLTPALVFGGFSFASVTTGGVHTCALILDGDAYCWGRNNVGQLGNGATGESWSPVRVKQ